MRLQPELENKQRIIECPVCNEAPCSQAIDDYKGYRLYHCHACDLMFWHPMISPAAEYYETMYDASPDLASFKAVKILWAQEQFLKGVPALGGELLDIGCGLGDFLFKAQKAGYSVTGIDFSAEFIKIAYQRFGLENLYPLTLEGFIAENPDNRYDVITFFEVLEHLDNITDFLSLLKKMLKPGGYVACSMPNRERWRFFSKQLLLYAAQERDYPPHHLTRWNPKALSYMFESQGFTALTVEREPLTFGSFSYGGWLLASKLGFQQRGVALAKKLAAREATQSGTPQNSDSSTMRGIMIKWGGWFYYKVFILLIGLLVSPLWFLLRRGGASNYLLVRLNETDSKAAEGTKGQ